MFETFENSLGLQNLDKGPKIKIIGVGGGGMNAVNKMIEDKIRGIDFIVANTDRQALKSSKATYKLVLGEHTTKGLGAGANPEIGHKAAQETIEQIKAIVKDTDLVFVTAGMGGGTGTGAAPTIAKAARDAGSLVVGIVTTPFSFEGKKRVANAVKGLEELSKHVDSIIVISNDRLLDELGGISLIDSFQYSDAILKQAVRTITDIVNEYSLINLDFADVKAVLHNAGSALIGVGRAEGENSAVEAAIDAINSPILESSIEGAKHAIVNITGSAKSLTIAKAQIAVETIKEAAGNDIDIIFGVTINDELADEIIVSVIATGISHSKQHPGHKKQSTIEDTTNINQYRQKHTTEFSTKNLDMLRKQNQHTSEQAKIREATTEELFKGFSLLDTTNEESLDDDDDFNR